MPLPDSPYPTEVPCTKAEILDTLHNWIILMQMKPGEKISDTELADYFHVSRTPVREVLKILEQQKLILTYPGKATVVADLIWTRSRATICPCRRCSAWLCAWPWIWRPMRTSTSLSIAT